MRAGLSPYSSSPRAVRSRPNGSCNRLPDSQDERRQAESDCGAAAGAGRQPRSLGLWAKTSPKYGRNIAADLKPEEIGPWARETVERHREDLGKDGMQVRCLPLGPAYVTSGDSTGSETMRIVQTPQLIPMLNPASIGRWEGDTLVVESYGFHPGTWLDRDGRAHADCSDTCFSPICGAPEKLKP
jgi:hypothetical protein